MFFDHFTYNAIILYMHSRAVFQYIAGIPAREINYIGIPLRIYHPGTKLIARHQNFRPETIFMALQHFHFIYNSLVATIHLFQ